VCARANTADSQCARRRRRRRRHHRRRRRCSRSLRRPATRRDTKRGGALAARAETAKTGARLRRANIEVVYAGGTGRGLDRRGGLRARARSYDRLTAGRKLAARTISTTDSDGSSGRTSVGSSQPAVGTAVLW